MIPLVAMVVAMTQTLSQTPLALTSPAFHHNAEIPTVFTCEGDDHSPPLAFGGVPAGAKSLALVLHDPDAPDPKAPKRIWVHWLVYNLPVDATGLPEAVKGQAQLPKGAREGTNDWARVGYGGPCPPIGRHRYVHTLYALDVVLPDLQAPTRAALLKAMDGHVLATTELIGTYEKKKKK